jgi:hypothetical protein
MKATGRVAGIGGVVYAVAAAGLPALAGAGILLAVMLGVLCWVLASTQRTTRLVRLIRALRVR